MGYIIGGRVQHAQDSLKEPTQGTVLQVPSVLPQRTTFGINKAQITGAQQKFGSDVTRNAPLFNDPRYTSSTLAIPTDDRTLHGLYRFFAETDPIVGSALKIHTELPLADLQLGQCEDTGVQLHFDTMWDRINGRKLLNDITSEYHEIGNVHPFGAFNEADYMWEQFAILNPDFVKVETTWVNQTPLIKLIPDEALKRIVQTKSPRFIYEQLPPELIRYVLFNQEIPLDPNNVFMISHAKRPYEAKGRSVIKRILKILMLEDRFMQAQFALATRHAVPLTVVKLGDATSGWVPDQTEIDSVRDMFSSFELDPNFCYDSETECLTKTGWQHYSVIDHTTEVACFNPMTSGLEYSRPQAINVQDYEGEMLHFEGLGYDMKVTPNHRMWVKRGDEDWGIKLAEDVEVKDQFRAVVDSYAGDALPETLEIAGERVRTEDWFSFAGWYLSEGSCYFSKKFNTYYTVNIAQKKGKTSRIISKLLNSMPWSWCKHDMAHSINNKALANFVIETFGRYSDGKKVPRWMLDAEPKYLQLLLDAWLLGDGSSWAKLDGGRFYKGYTTSKPLADAMQEVCFKLGYAVKVRLQPTKSYRSPATGIVFTAHRDGSKLLDLYVLHITKGKRLSFPMISNKDAEFELVDLSDIVAVPKMAGLKRKRDWSGVDIPQLLQRTNGVVRPLAKALKVDAATLWNHIEEDEIDVTQFYETGVSVSDGKRFTPQHIHRVPYTGKIWCVTVPTGIIVTRRNGKIAVQGQSIFYHYGISVEYYGSNGKMLPVGPELDRIYRLKFMGMGIHEQLLSGQGGSYSQAYVNLEVQRQRYLNLQLKLEQFVHEGLFKPVADLCGFYKVNQPTAGYGKVSSKKWGNPREAFEKQFLSAYTELRDYQDNQEFRAYAQRKYEEYSQEQQNTIREYVYPELDWGQMSATTDENLKNYIKWLSEKRPWLVDDATLARLGRLDRDTQEDAYISDLERAQKRLLEISKKGLLPFAKPQGKGGAGGAGGGGGEPVDFGGIGDIGMGGGPPGAEGVGGGPTPPGPIGAGGPPDAAGMDQMPAGAKAGIDDLSLLLRREGTGVLSSVSEDDVQVSAENEVLLRARAQSKQALEKIVNGGIL